MFRKAIGSLVIASQLAACASSPDSIGASYISPSTYNKWTCETLSEEQVRLYNEVNRVSGAQKRKSDNDGVMMAVGLILFWPALFALSAGRDHADQLANLKGQYDAVQTAMRGKGCAINTAATIR